MAKKTNTAPKSAPTPAEESQAHQNRLDLLQRTMVKLAKGIDDPVRGFVGRAIRARSVDPKVIEAGFKELEASIKRARETYAAAIREDEVAEVARVDLRTL